VAEEQERRLVRATELLAALDTALAEFQALADDAGWIESASNGGRAVEPYRAAGGDRSVGQLRGAIRFAFDDWNGKREQREAERRRLEAWEDEQRGEWERRAKAAAAQQAAARVVVSDGRIVEKGGRPVRQTGFGVQPLEEDES
jgi:hypothetical protein